MIPALDALFAAASQCTSIAHHTIPLFTQDNHIGGVQHIILGES